MELTDRVLVVTGAGRGTGRALALRAGRLGARVLLSARSERTARAVAAEVTADSGADAEGLPCDLADPASVRDFAAAVAARTDRVDVLVNNGARYLPGTDLLDADDEAVADTIASTATGTVLLTRHLLPLLRASAAADVVNLVSGVAEPRNHRSDSHPAFYAAKAAQAGFADVLSARLRPEGIRVISLYPPDFTDADPLDPSWDTAPRTAADPLTAQSVTDCVLFAVSQPRDCFIRSFHFEQL
ncbi:oxidoreductase [Kitasatospora phosalacinea]|uniref:Oxidoreductase n=1 Tax=Kitasatospora phosalacinea TaxID=2065 RepID=A0A9W6V2R2_9ACTN|nr:SDR family NAD(P)-dependent oxidoreductase [Kitasatospora phosalacinea]GLW70502.1 oxidoreductase [Kitasatospora phosalacinea]